jgi:hypothetical protein
LVVVSVPTKTKLPPLGGGVVEIVQVAEAVALAVNPDLKALAFTVVVAATENGDE